MGIKMRTENIIMPTTMIDSLEGDAPKQLLGVITGHECIPCEGGSDKRGRTISYYDCYNGFGYTLTYDYAELGVGMSKLIDPEVIRDERFDGMFDVSRERLENVLKDFDEQYKDWDGMHELFIRLGGKFGIMI